MGEDDLFGSESKDESSHGWMRDGTFTKRSRLSKSGESEGVGRGILNNAYGPRDEPNFPVTKREPSWLRSDQDDDADEVMSRPRTMMSVRPVTGMSQVGDFIPTLEDLTLSQENSDAPQVSVNTLASYQDLERDRSRQAVIPSLDGIDLSLLVKRLLPERELVEKDEPWTWDGLISNISSRLQPQSEDSQELNLLKVNSE